MDPLARKARPFRNGRNQAVRIPREWELPGEKILMYLEGNRLVLEPLAKRPHLKDVLRDLESLDEDFPLPEDPIPETDELFPGP